MKLKSQILLGAGHLQNIRPAKICTHKVYSTHVCNIHCVHTTSTILSRNSQNALNSLHVKIYTFGFTYLVCDQLLSSTFQTM